MFGIGGQELIVILVIALIVLGPKKLPDIAKSLGKAFGEFQKATDDLKREMDISSTLKDGADSPSNQSTAAGDAQANPEKNTGDEPEAKPQADDTGKKTD